MKKLCSILTACLLWHTGLPQDLAIVPRPLQIQQRPGHFRLRQQTTVFADDSMKAIARYVCNYVKDCYGWTWTAARRSAYSGKGILLSAAAVGAEAYTLTIAPGSVRISGGGAGVFYGVQTMLQLIHEPEKGAIADIGELPCLEITDRPRFHWRGLSLDVSRHFFSVATVKKYIDVMAHYKLNVLHWHLVDDEGWRIQIDKYPLLTTRGSSMSRWAAEGKFRPLDNITGGGNEGFYTKEEVREIVAYAGDRFITVLPEIEMPGHSEASIYAYPELGVEDSTGETQRQRPFPRVGMYDPSEKVFSFLEDVLTEVMALFPSPYIHIGGDEAEMKRWLKSPVAVAVMKREGLATEKEVQSYFIRRIEKFLLSRGRKLVGWDEILAGGLAPSATVMSWTGEEGGITAARMHHPVIMTPLPYVYFDAPQSDDASEPVGWNYPISWQHVYAYEPVPAVLGSEDAKYILGAQANIWTEKIPTPQHLEYMVYPRALALAEDCWTEPSKKDLADFTGRLDHQYALLNRWKVHARLPDIEGLELVSTNKPSFRLALRHPLKDAVIRYTLDGSAPEERSPLYDRTLTIDAAATQQGWQGRPGDSIRIRTLVVSPESDQHRTQSQLIRFVAVGSPSAAVNNLLPGLAFHTGPISASENPSDTSHRPGVSGVCPTPDFPGKYIPGGFSEIISTGYIVIPSEGDYRLSVAADGETVLSLGGQTIIDNRGYHGTYVRESLLHLAKGGYPLSLSYRNEDGPAGSIRLTIRNGSGDRIDAAAILFHLRDQ